VTKVCLACKQELPMDLFSPVMVKGVQKRQGKCTPCRRVYRKAYYEANRERCKAQMREWQKNNPDYCANWQKENPDKVKQYRAASRPRAREYMREQYWKDPEAARLRSKQFKATNPELIKTEKRRWAAENKEHLRKYFSRKTAELSDSYIRNKLATNHKRERTLRSKDIPQELVELKRLQLLLQRELKNETHK